MLLMLIGADREENLGICHVAACAAAAGHKVQVVPFDEPSQTDSVVARVMGRKPACVGLAIQFQHRAHEFLTLAARLRQAGFEGHITSGGQFPTMAWRELLTCRRGVDSAVLHDGEHTIVELLGALEAGAPLSDVKGLAYLSAGGEAIRTEARPLVAELDAMPVARRYRQHTRHFGVPFIPISGGRGCWGRCTYCSITTCSHDARQQVGGKLLRLRSPRSIATEIAVLWHAAGGSGIFCFHDDNFLLPRPADSLARVTELRGWLDEFGVGKAALVGKCRPECVTPELAKALRKRGVIRLYIGIENASQHSADSLNRRTSTEDLHRALDAAADAGIFPCYNLLIFEPRARLEDIEQNIAFMRRHATIPVNFCRAEAYHETPLCQDLRARGVLSGSFLGWDYRLDDDRAELLFRISAAIFRERNFGPRGVTNRSMGLGYATKVLEVFHEDRDGIRTRLVRRAKELTREIVLDKAEMLEAALAIAKNADLRDRDRIERETVLLGLRVSAGNKIWHAALDDLIEDMNAFAHGSRPSAKRVKPNRRLVNAMHAVAVVSLLSVSAAGCGGNVETDEPQVYDALPYDAGTDADAANDAIDEPQVYDALPYDAGTDADAEADVTDEEPQVYDDLPYDSGIEDAEDEPQVYDALPYDGGVDASEDGKSSAQFGAAPAPHAKATGTGQTVESWRDTSPRKSVRSKDLPLYQPPSVHLTARHEGEALVVSVEGCRGPVGTRWEADGVVRGEGAEVQWAPESRHDQICVAVRTRGGVAFASLRASEVADG